MTQLHLLQNCPGSVRGTVIDHDNFQIDILLSQQSGQGRGNSLRLIAGRNNEGDKGCIRCHGRSDITQTAESAATESNIHGQPTQDDKEADSNKQYRFHNNLSDQSHCDLK